MTDDECAKKIFEYMKLDMKLEMADVVLGLSCLETRVAKRAAQLMLDGYGNLLMFSGGYGRLTQKFNNKPEAEIFYDIATKMGVDKHKIILEKQATNTGENCQFAEKLLDSKNIKVKKIIIVAKPYMERRAYATFKKQWQDSKTKIIVTSPKISYEESYNEQISKDLFINTMVGDLQRIKLFPKLGFQIEQDISKDVWRSFEILVKRGYDKQLV